LGKFEGLGAKVVGVSKDSLNSHARFREKHGFTFPLLADPEHQMMEDYGAWGEKRMSGKLVQGALRSTVVVGADGRIERVYLKVKAKGHAQAVLEDLGG
jgi:peroxiredoxin Q/BCP